ncbi:MAG: hypothetical protein KBT69_10960 [Oceanihabitans sp.]|nr:hypothetical protein [Oceanihabitans sp.]
MASNIFQTVTHIYKEINDGKLKAIKEYKLQEIKIGITHLTDLIICKTHYFDPESDQNYWLQIHDNTKWKKPRYTKLLCTEMEYVLKGASKKHEDLILIDLSSTCDELVVFYFINYFQKNHTRDFSDVFKHINHNRINL